MSYEVQGLSNIHCGSFSDPYTEILSETMKNLAFLSEQSSLMMWCPRANKFTLWRVKKWTAFKFTKVQWLKCDLCGGNQLEHYDECPEQDQLQPEPVHHGSRLDWPKKNTAILQLRKTNTFGRVKAFSLFKVIWRRQDSVLNSRSNRRQEVHYLKAKKVIWRFFQ